MVNRQSSNGELTIVFIVLLSEAKKGLKLCKTENNKL